MDDRLRRAGAGAWCDRLSAFKGHDAREDVRPASAGDAMTPAWITYLMACLVFVAAATMFHLAGKRNERSKEIREDTLRLRDETKTIQERDIKMLTEMMSTINRAKAKMARPDDENFIKFVESTKPEDMN